MPAKVVVQIVLKLIIRRHSLLLTLPPIIALTLYIVIAPSQLAVDIASVLVLMVLLSTTIMDSPSIKRTSEGLRICGATRGDVRILRLIYITMLSFIGSIPIFIAVLRGALTAVLIIPLFYIIAYGGILRE